MTPQEITRDPNFLALSPPERIKVLRNVDPNFEGLAPEARLKVAMSLGKPPAETVPAAAPTAPAEPGWDAAGLRERWDASAPRRAGVAKSVGGTVLGLGELVRRAVGSDTGTHGTADALMGAVTPEERPTKVATDIAQFFIPGPAGKTKVAAALGDAGLTALLTGAQGGDTKDVATAGVVSAALPPAIQGALRVLLAGGKKVSGPLAELVAERMKAGGLKQMEQVLGATTKENKAISAKVAPGLIERGETAITEGRMLQRAQQQAGHFGEKVEQELAKIPADAQVRTQPLLDHMRAAKEEFRIGEQTVTRQVPVPHGADGSLALDAAGNPAMRTITEKVPIYADDARVATIDKIADVVAKHGETMTADQAIKLRRVYDQQIAQAKGFAGKTLAEGSQIEAKKELANAIRHELAKDYPDLAKVNQEFSFWKNVEKVLEDTAARKGPQAKPLGEQVGKAAAVTGAIASKGEPTAMAMAATYIGLNKLVRSTAWKTYGAVYKTRVADALAKGDWAAAGKLIQQTAAAAAAKIPKP